MKHCKLIVRDAVNVRFEGLDVSVRKRMSEALKFIIPEARHTPQYKLGRWHGTVSFCSPAGSTFLNLLDRLLPIIYEDGYEIEVDDRRPLYDFRLSMPDENIFAHINWPPGHTLSGQPIILRDYQLAAIRTFIAELQGIQVLATASGKTILTAALSYLIEPYGRSIIIVPNRSLVMQTEKDYRNVGLDVGVYYGARKEYDHKHTICTWQSLGVFSKRGGKKGKKPQEVLPYSIMDFLDGVVCVIVDELHQAQAPVLRNLLTGPFAHVPIRWGITGTMPKAEHEALAILASVGLIVGELRAVELQEKGVLANCKIFIEQLREEHAVDFSNYESEHEFLVKDKTRLVWLANRCIDIAQTGNTLILVDRIETGTILQQTIPGAIFINGQTKDIERTKQYDAVNTATNMVIIATFGVASVGINIPRLFNLILFECGKSFIRTIQSAGRVLRKANDKSSANIYDICSDLKFSRRHLTKRKEFYKESEYPFTSTKVDYL